MQGLKKAAAAVVGVAALAAGGSALADAASSGSGKGQTPRPSQPSFPAHGTAAHEDAETPVTGSAADKAKAAAVASVGGGTAGDVTTDYFGNGYEVTVTTSDGSSVEVHLDSSFDVMQGRGGGGPPPGPDGRV